MDPNSYEKDDETNWIDYRHPEINRELVEYYRGLISIRKNLPELRAAPPGDYRFFEGPHMHACGFALKREGEETYIALVNSSKERDARFELPDGMWSVLADAEGAGLDVRNKGVVGSVTLPPTSAMFLVREYESPFG
jgi:pullulanase/glycogen debranching enzyme